MTSTRDEKEATEYLFDSGSDLGLEHLTYLETLLDARSIAMLEPVGVQPGHRCLEIGAGTGSIARWLAARSGRTGKVLACDIDTTRLHGVPDVEVVRHDINDGVPPGGPFDLIHARFVLTHLPRREQILADLVDALAPGGWLVIGDPLGPPLEVISAPSPADAELFQRVQHTSCYVVAPASGIAFDWAPTLDDHFARSGLANVHTERHTQTTTGGGAGCRLHANLNRQAEAPLLAAGLSKAELDRYRALMLDPRFRAWFHDLYYTRGQKQLA